MRDEIVQLYNIALYLVSYSSNMMFSRITRTVINVMIFLSLILEFIEIRSHLVVPVALEFNLLIRLISELNRNELAFASLA